MAAPAQIAVFVDENRANHSSILAGRQAADVTSSEQFLKSQPLLKCVQLGNLLLAGLRNAYCVRAGETATIQMLCSPETSRFQTGFTLDAIALPFNRNTLQYQLN